jgi:hypothetical protein
MGEMRNSCTILIGKPEGKRAYGILGVEGKIVLNWILGKEGGKLWIGWMWIGTSGGL